MKYKCNDCQHVFEGNDFTTECPQCNSNNIVLQKPMDPIDIAIIKRILIGVGVIIIILLLFRFCDGEPDESDNGDLDSLTVGVDIQQKGNGYFFSAYTKDKKGKRTVIQAYGVEKIRNTLTNKEVAFNKKNGQLFICFTDTGSTSLKFIFKDSDLSDTVWTGDLHLFGKAPSSEAKCPITLSWDDFRVVRLKNCEYELQLSPSGSKRPISLKYVKISINGINGPYTHKLKWNADDAPNRKFDIYLLYDEKDTIKGYKLNGGDYSKCIVWTSEKAKELAQKILSLANAYGANPSNRNLSKPFRELIFSFPNQIISLDGQRVDMADLENTMSTEFENSGRKYRLKGLPTFNSDGTQVTIHFVSI